MIVHWIPTKLGTEIHFNCRRRRNKDKTKTLVTRISEMAMKIIFKLCIQTPLPGRHFCSKFGSNRIRNYRRTLIPLLMHLKIY